MKFLFSDLVLFTHSLLGLDVVEEDWTLTVLVYACWNKIGLGKQDFFIKHNAKGLHTLHMFHVGTGQGETNYWSHPGKTALEYTPESLCAAHIPYFSFITVCMDIRCLVIL